MPSRAERLTEEAMGLIVPESFQRQEVEQLMQSLQQPGFLEQTAQTAAVPTAFSIGGGTLGGLVAGGPGAVAGEAIGGGLGEAMNQLSGLTEPSLTQIGLSALAGPAFQALRVGGKLIPPSTRGARLLNRFGFEDAESLMARFVPEDAAKVLFPIVERATEKIPMTRTLRVLDGTAQAEGLLRRLSTRSSPPRVLKALQRVRDLIAQDPAGITPRALQNELETVGEAIRSMEKKGGSGLGAVKQTFNAMMADLDHIVKTADDAVGAAALQGARKATLRAKTVDEISESINRHFIPKQGQGADRSFNAAAVVREIEANPFFTKAFSEAEQHEIKDILLKINTIPGLPSTQAQKLGQGLFGGRVGSFTAGGAGLGSAAEMLTTGGVTGAGASLGGGAGAMTALIIPVNESRKVIAKALAMPAGRQFLLNSLGARGKVTTEALSILAGFLRAATAEPGPRAQASQRASFTRPQ